MPWRKIALAAVAAAVLLLSYRFGVFEAFRDPGHMKETLLELGKLGFLIYLLAYAVLQPFGIPSVAFIVAASLVWPPPVAIALSLTGSMLATVSGFSFARYLARDWVEKRIPTRFRKYDERLETHGFLTVFALRSVLWSNPTLHALFGLSRLRFSTHFVASFLAYIAPVVAITFLGEAAIEALKHQPLERWIEAGCAVAAAVAVGFLIQRYRSRQLEMSRAKPPS